MTRSSTKKKKNVQRAKKAPKTNRTVMSNTTRDTVLDQIPEIRFAHLGGDIFLRVETLGSVIENHDAYLYRKNSDKWHRHGTNVPDMRDPIGTPDTYRLPDPLTLNNGWLDVTGVIINPRSQGSVSYSVQVTLHQDNNLLGTIVDRRNQSIDAGSVQPYHGFASLRAS